MYFNNYFRRLFHSDVALLPVCTKRMLSKLGSFRPVTEQEDVALLFIYTYISILSLWHD